MYFYHRHQKVVANLLGKLWVVISDAVDYKFVEPSGISQSFFDFSNLVLGDHRWLGKIFFGPQATSPPVSIYPLKFGYIITHLLARILAPQLARPPIQKKSSPQKVSREKKRERKTSGQFIFFPLLKKHVRLRVLVLATTVG